MRLQAFGAIAVAGAVGLVGCSADPDVSSDPLGSASPSASGVAVQTATEVVQVTTPHQASGGTLLEGPTFDASGLLYVVDVMAPAGAPKVLTVDLEDRDVESAYTDESSAFTSAQFGPRDGRLYLTDIASGSILSIDSGGEDPQVEFAGAVGDSPMLPDDLTFDADGNMFISDTRGMREPGWETQGRVIRIDTDGTATVLADDLPSPNGIAFDESSAGLWIAQYNANRIDYYALSPDGTAVQAAYPGFHVDAGRGRVDSTAVDAEGHIYQAFHGIPQINVYGPSGTLEQIIRVPGDGLDSATNVAIRPGTTDGYLTVSGPAGGYLYAFDALGEGTRQSNGG